MKISRILAIAMGLFLCLNCALSATTIHIPGDSATIQAGINGAVNGDTVLVADGTYIGDGNRDIDFLGKAIVVMSENGPENTIINCEGGDTEPHRGFLFANGEDTVSILSGFKIQGGYGHFDGPDMESQAGGILFINNSSPLIYNCIFIDNFSEEYGGALGLRGASPVIRDCTIKLNTAYGWGGGIYSVGSSPNIVNTIIEGNESNNGGGALLVTGIPYFDNCIFLNNSSSRGGGVLINTSSPIINNCIFYNNYGGNGGAIFIQNSDNAVVSNCTFTNNESPNACINSDNSFLLIEYSIIAFNIDGQSVAGGVPQLVCCDLFGNDGGDWVGGIFNQFGIDGNISVDPLFCDTANGNFNISISSPCHPDSSCGLIGSNDVGCMGEMVTDFGIEGEASILNIVNHTPIFLWDYWDSLSQSIFELAVGIDNDWQYAEMWNPSIFYTSDTFVTYAGAPLIDGIDYYLRLRLSDGSDWSTWYETSFHMNSIPSIPIAISPINDIIVDANQPTLWVQNSTDGEPDDTLTYDYVIANDTAFGEPDPIWDDSITEGTDSTGWQVTEPLNENWHYFWSARAFDQYEYCDWSETQTFWVNAVEESPGDFETFYPPDTDEVIITDMLSLFWWGEAVEPDPLDSVYYTLLISLDSNFNFVNTIDSIWTNLYTLTADDSLDFGTHYWWKVKATDNTDRSTYSTNTRDFQTWMLGDANGDLQVNILDVTFLINYLYKGGTPPWPIVMGDIDGSCSINILDVTYLINYLYKSGPAPLVGCE